MIERDFCVRKVSGGDSLWGFVRGLFVVLEQSRAFFRLSENQFILYTIGLYVLQHIKGVVKLAIMWVNERYLLTLSVPIKTNR